MIKPDAKLSIQRIPLECLQVKEYQRRHCERFNDYFIALFRHPGEYPGLISVVPSDTHPGMYAILDGHHRFCASIMGGREDLLCVIVEDA